jgi:hypothetical protein
MNLLARLIVRSLLIVGGASVFAGVAYFSWLMWTNPRYALFNLLVPLMILGGIVVMAIGLAIRSSAKS